MRVTHHASQRRPSRERSRTSRATACWLLAATSNTHEACCYQAERQDGHTLHRAGYDGKESGSLGVGGESCAACATTLACHSGMPDRTSDDISATAFRQVRGPGNGESLTSLSFSSLK